MDIFPQINYSFKLYIDSPIAIAKLKSQTLDKDQFVSNWNKQAFIGVVNENEFEIKLSKKLFGEFCVLKGRLTQREGTLKIETGRTFKIIFICILLFVFSGIIIAIIENVFESILPLIMVALIMRFIFLELGFRIISKAAIKKLTDIIEIEVIKKQ